MQLNDTHPAISIAELMRLLVDEKQLSWDKAWTITHKFFATPITPCCRKLWKNGPCRLFAAVLPRHLEIIFEINRRFLDDVRLQYPGDEAKVGQTLAN